ncbi:MAG: hypothetical protein NTW20_03245 [Rhodobacterales bacterium]|nr:hypothetical protein [Rhodobacterales bacterium]
MSLTQLLETIPSIVTALAAVIGLRIAWLGLSTWKQQIRWQQGRGLAINLLQAFFEFQDRVIEVRRFTYSNPDNTVSDAEKVAMSQETWNRAKEHDEKLAVAYSMFQKSVAEAIVVWKEDFREIMSDLQEVKHIASSLVLTGAASADPKRTKSARSASSTLYQAFSGDFYGTSEDRRGIGGRLADIESKIREKIDLQGLS